MVGDDAAVRPVLQDALAEQRGLGRERTENHSRMPLCKRPTATKFPDGLDIYHICDMASHMKTTLNIDDTVMAQLRREAIRQGRTMSELVEVALRMLFRHPKKRGRIPKLPAFRSGGMLVDGR